ncbi:MAG: hypothetical protein LBD86_02665 [Spirochaetaceae bacterium]|nr:hypothetical protein [Spirochaetaceae bacterium]
MDILIRTGAGLLDVPIAAYSVLGEYAIIKSAAAGLIDGAAEVYETAASVFRAVTDIPVSHFAPELPARGPPCRNVTVKALFANSDTLTKAAW